MTLKLTAIQSNPRTTHITVSGRLNSETFSAFEKQVQKTMIEGSDMIVLELSGLELITSAGVGAIMKAQTSLIQKGGELMMVNMQPQIQKVFEIVRLMPTLKVFENTQEMDDYLLKIQQRIQEDGSFDSIQ